MKKQSLFLVLLITAFAATAQPERLLDSKITDVTVFLARAQVTRQARTTVEAGKYDLVFTGLTGHLDPQSIQVSGKGKFTILNTSFRQNFLNDLNIPKPVRALRDSLKNIQSKLSQEQSQRAVLDKEEQLLMANQKIGGNQNLTAAELKAMADFFRARMSDIIVNRAKADDRMARLNERQARIQMQLNEQTELYSRHSGEVVVSISADAGSEVQLELNYMVMAAGWNPIYDIRATNTKSPLRLQYKAQVRQASGEDWKNVRLTLSTGNPTLGGLKPELAIQYVDFFQAVAMYNEKARMMSSAPAMAKREDESVEVLADAVTMDEFVSTIETTLNTKFDVAIPYTVQSSNQPVLVDLRSDELAATYKYAVAPKLDTDAFLIASATGWEQLGLLPGEANIYFEGTFVGKTLINPMVIQDTLALSLGRDKRVVVKREKVKSYTTRKAIAANMRETIAYEISVNNTRNEAVTVVVEDQIPVSRNNQIEVLMTDAGGAQYDRNTGKLTWKWVLQPNEQKKVSFRFEVKYPKDRPIQGL